MQLANCNCKLNSVTWVDLAHMPILLCEKILYKNQVNVAGEVINKVVLKKTSSVSHELL